MGAQADLETRECHAWTRPVNLCIGTRCCATTHRCPDTAPLADLTSGCRPHSPLKLLERSPIDRILAIQPASSCVPRAGRLGGAGEADSASHNDSVQHAALARSTSLHPSSSSSLLRRPVPRDGPGERLSSCSERIMLTRPDCFIGRLHMHPNSHVVEHERYKTPSSDLIPHAQVPSSSRRRSSVFWEEVCPGHGFCQAVQHGLH